jgi:hypothetical protein
MKSESLTARAVDGPAHVPQGCNVITGLGTRISINIQTLRFKFQRVTQTE